MSPLISIVLAVAGVAFGYYFRYIVAAGKKGSMELEIKQMMLEAKERAKGIEEEAEKKIESRKRDFEKDIKEKGEFIKKAESRMLDREAFLDKRQSDIDSEVEHVKHKIEEVHTVKARVDELKAGVEKEIERVAHLTKEDAKQELLQRLEKESQEDVIVRIRKLELYGKEQLEKKAQEILTTAIHRLGNAVTTDVLTTSIALQNEEIKGKIIGKEGRNIRTFERVTGVDVLIDDTPGLITLS